MTNAVLVFPPFVRPFSIPAGISYLKSYAAKFLPDVKVKCLDLNSVFHEGLLAHYANNSSAKEFIDSFNFFKTKSLDFDLKKAKGHAGVFLPVLDNIYDKYVGIFSQMLAKGSGLNNLAKKLALVILKHKPDIVGFSVNHDKQWHLSLVLGILLRSKGVKVVFGGNFFSTRAEAKFFPMAMDYALVGEGEKGFVELLKAVKNNSGFDSVPGLVYVRGNSVVSNEPEPIRDLDSIPFPDYSWFNPREYFSPLPVLPVLTSRGCFWRKCAFCIHHKNFLGYRQRSVENVVDEIKGYVNQGVRHFNFIDEMVSSVRFKQLADAFTREKLSINYFAMAKPTKDFTFEVFKKMFESGCRMILWGLESANQRVLDLINKGTNVEDIRKVLAEASRAGIRNHVFLIFGFPTETEEELRDTLNFVYDNRGVISGVHKGPFALEYGSQIFFNPEKFGISNIYDRDRILNKYKYDVDKGMSYNEKELFSRKFAGFCESFCPLGNYMSACREHALVIYSERPGDFDKLERNVHLLPK